MPSISVTGNELIETRGEHNHDISEGNSDARNVIKQSKELSKKLIPTVVIASAILPVTNEMATQFALPTKDKLNRTAAGTLFRLILIKFVSQVKGSCFASASYAR